MFDIKIEGFAHKNENGQLIGEDGTKYNNLNSREIDEFCKRMKGDKTSQELGEIYENVVPKISFDTEAIVSGMRNRAMGG